MKKNYQRNCTFFLAKYGGISIYDIDQGERFSVDDEDSYVKGYRYA